MSDPISKDDLVRLILCLTEPSRTVDAEVARTVGVLIPYVDPMPGHGALHGYEFHGEQRAFTASWWAPDLRCQWPPSAAKIAEQMPAIPNYTASLDAALALAEEVAPKISATILREAISAEAKRHDRHMCFATLDIAELARDVVVALLRHLDKSKLT